jgi:hypothetical protein
MIYINNDTTIIKVPKYLGDIYDLTFEVKNKMNEEVLSFAITEEAPAQLYYSIDVSEYAAGLINGEYIYKVKSGDKVLSVGLLIVGDYNDIVKEYSKTPDVIYYDRG